MPIDEKPSRNEDEYFAKEDADLIKGMRAKLDAERAKSARAMHSMKCPKCGGDLKEQARGQLKIDVCSDCKGVWLDAGEIDLIRQADRNPVRSLLGELLTGKK